MRSIFRIALVPHVPPRLPVLQLVVARVHLRVRLRALLGEVLAVKHGQRPQLQLRHGEALQTSRGEKRRTGHKYEMR